MDKVREYLEAGKRLEGAATPGPWYANSGEEGYELTCGYDAATAAPFSEFAPMPSFVPNDDPIGYSEEQRARIVDAERFIADARERLPRYRRAIEALLKMHGYPRQNPDGSPYYEGKVDGYAEATRDLRDTIAAALLGDEKADA